MSIRPSAKSHAGRARANGTFDQLDRSITRRTLGYRDNWVCQACGCATPEFPKWDADNVRPDYPTIGHIKAMVLGGAHVWSNVQLECWQCNNTKSIDERRQAYELGLTLVKDWVSSDRLCEGCSSTYRPRNRNQRFCSGECSYSARRPYKAKPSKTERAAERMAAIQDRIWGS